MSIRDCSILGLICVGLQMFGVAQNAPAQNATNSSVGTERSVPAPALSAVAGIETGVPDEAGSDLPHIPALLGGRGASLAFQSEMERSNYLRAGLNVGAAYDDNALLAPSGGQGDTSITIFPNIALEESWSRMRWALTYAGGFTVHQGLTSRNQGSHDVSFDSQFRLSPHVNLRVAEDFAVTTGFFDGGNGTAVSGTGGPNASLIAPLATQRTNSTTAEANYHFALNDVIGGSGSFYDLHFTNLPKGAALADTRTVTGSAFWLHRTFRHNWTGASYIFERISFDPGAGETRVHSLALIDTLGLSRGFTFSAFIGPQYSDNRGLTPAGDAIPQFQQWSMSGGVEVGWQSARTSVSTGYSRRITDGGGVLGAVRLQSVHGDVRRELFPGWAVRVGGRYGSNHSLTVPFSGAGSTIDLTSASVSLERNIGKSLGLRLGYSHDFQEQSGFADPTQKLDAHRNRFFVTLSYQWAKPLGM